MAELHAAANAPLFAAHSVFLGAGIVGGRLISIDDLSRRTADAAIGILNGAPPRGGEVLRRSTSQPMFDWRELQRWGSPRVGCRPAAWCAIEVRTCGANTGARFCLPRRTGQSRRS